MTTDQILEDVRLVLDSPGVNPTATGSWNRELTRCSGCGAEADDWGNYAGLEHEPSCKTVLADQAEARLRAAIAEKDKAPEVHFVEVGEIEVMPGAPAFGIMVVKVSETPLGTKVFKQG